MLYHSINILNYLTKVRRAIFVLGNNSMHTCQAKYDLHKHNFNVLIELVGF